MTSVKALHLHKTANICDMHCFIFIALMDFVNFLVNPLCLLLKIFFRYFYFHFKIGMPCTFCQFQVVSTVTIIFYIALWCLMFVAFDLLPWL